MIDLDAIEKEFDTVFAKGLGNQTAGELASLANHVPALIRAVRDARNERVGFTAALHDGGFVQWRCNRCSKIIVDDPRNKFHGCHWPDVQIEFDGTLFPFGEGMVPIPCVDDKITLAHGTVVVVVARTISPEYAPNGRAVRIHTVKA